MQQLLSDGSSWREINTIWTYDGLGRLTGELVLSTESGGSYQDVYSYDLQSNRMSLDHTLITGVSYTVTVSPGNDAPPFWTAMTFTLEQVSPTEWDGTGDSPYFSMSAMTGSAMGSWQLELQTMDAGYTSTASAGWSSTDKDLREWILQWWDPTDWEWQDDKGDDGTV